MKLGMLFNAFTASIPDCLCCLGKEFVLCELNMFYVNFLNLFIQKTLKYHPFVLWMFNFITTFKGYNKKVGLHFMYRIDPH